MESHWQTKYKLVIMICYLAILTIYFWNSILAKAVQFMLGADLARFSFHCNPNYVMCAHKTMM